MDLGQPGNRGEDVIGTAKDGGYTGVASLLERFKKSPDQTRHKVRVELGWFNEMATSLGVADDPLLSCRWSNENEYPRRAKGDRLQGAGEETRPMIRSCCCGFSCFCLLFGVCVVVSGVYPLWVRQYF